MRWIIEAGMRFRLLVLPLAAGLMLFGAVQLHKIPVDVLPEFTPTTVEVQTEALGLSAEEVEQLITVPLEQDLLVGVPFLDEIESASLPGLSSVVMTFEPGTDMLDARQVVQERLTQAVGVAGLPEVAKPPQMIQPMSSYRRAAMIKLGSEKLSPIDVSVLARWVISPRLMGVPGVANVTVWGFRDRQLQVLVDPAKLKANGTTLAQVIATAGNALEVSPLTFLEASSPGTGGFIDTVNQRLNIFHEQTIKTAADLAKVPLESAAPENGAAGQPAPAAPPKTLGDVATVVENHQPLIGDAVCAGGQQCLYLVVEKFPDANAVEVTKGVEAAMASMAPGLTGVTVDTSLYRPATFIESSFQHLSWALLAGVVLMLIAAALLLWSWRKAVIIAVAVPLSLAVAVVVLYLRDTTVNPMIVAGLVLGLTAVIHDVVADTHHAARDIREYRLKGGSPDAAGSAVSHALAGVRGSIVYAILIVAAATVPIFFLEGAGKAFLAPIALSYLLAVLASMLVALLVTPALALLLLGRGPVLQAGSPAAGPLRRGYDRVAPRVLGHTGIAIASAAALALLGALALPFLHPALRPGFQERDVLVHLEAAPGTSLPKMTEITKKAVADIGALPGVAGVGGHVGRAVMSDQIVNVNAGKVWVKVEPGADYAGTIAAIRDKVHGYQGVSSDVGTYSQERVNDILGERNEDVEVRIYGENPQVLAAKAEEIKGLLGRVKGVSAVNIERALDEPAVEVTVDLAKAQAAGVKPGDVRRAAATLVGGLTVGNLFDQQKVFDVVVWGDPKIRQSAADVEQLLVDTPNGGQVRIGDVAQVKVAPNPAVILHEDVSNHLDVTADVSGRDVGAVAGDVREQLKQVQFPLEHHAEVVGRFEERQAALVKVAWTALAAAIAIFLLLQSAFRSWRLALLALIALPLATVGGVLAALFTGGLSLGASAGLIAVFGLAARAVVLLIRRYQQLELVDGVPFGRDLVVRGTKDAAATTVVCAVAIAALLLPIAIFGGASGLEILRPMSVVVLGGLVTLLIVVLFVLPVLYLRFGQVRERDTAADDLFGPAPAAGPARPAADGGVMRRIRAVLVTVPLLGALALSGCGGVIPDKYKIEGEPATVEEIEGSDHVRITLTEQAAKRLALQTSPVTATPQGLTVPAGAAFLDDDGEWFVYTNPAPLVYERHEVTVKQESGQVKHLSHGPAPGTPVVVVGVQELAGIEDEVGH
ncbi:cation efflux system protein [Catellatospora sp. IY07-71]|uniref:efflux RND transporter permease subunit n=1 Tax=Catellatospora sp. IY07-71 TaxID=2728827 RepID=UPI001BB3524E|nr:efflux RND transporter permease subunit [Catellatospora sp. IY07-71]BCJ77779.1 cation efflux system protein [Catellatospora sp. IY07-71]